MGAYRYVELSASEDEVLREIEQGVDFNKKVRLRSQILRLSNQGWEMEAIARYVGCHVRSVGNVLDGWEAAGVEGLADLPQKGNRRKLNTEVLEFIAEKLSEARNWNALQLVEAIAESFDLTVSKESVRRNLKELGYAWKRDRFVVAGQPDPKVFQQAKANLETLKRGPKKVG